MILHGLAVPSVAVIKRSTEKYTEHFEIKGTDHESFQGKKICDYATESSQFSA
jgi:hypothetical protein